MKKIHFLLSLFVLIIIASCNNKTGSGEKITLKPNFKVGDSYEVEYNMDINQEIMGLKSINMNMGFAYKMDIKNIAAQSDYEMNLLYDKMAMSMKSPVFSFSYNSDSTEKANPDSLSKDNEMLKVVKKLFSGMLGKSITVLMDTSGKVKEVRGYKEMMKNITDSATAAGRELPKELFSNMSEDQVRQLFQQTFGMYPGKPIGVGDKWSSEFSLAQNGIPMKTKTTYKVAEINPIENEVILDLDGTVSSDGDGTMEKMGMKMKMNIDGTQKGQMTIDTKTGFVKEGKITQEMKADMEAMNHKIPMVMKNTITIFGKKL